MWLAGDESVGTAYGNALLRAGQLELASFPLHILQQLFTKGVSDAALLYGEPIGSIKQILEERFEAFIHGRDPHFPEGPPDFLRQSGVLNRSGVDTLIWFPNVRELSWRRNWKRFDATSVTIRNGEIDEEALRNTYASLQVDFVLPGHAGLNQPYAIYHTDAALDSNLAIPNYADSHVLGRNADFLIIFNDVPSDWEDFPRIAYGRCEDYPCCGHDVCPLREADSGVVLAMSCICGKLLPRDAASSICSRCLRYGGNEPGGYDDTFEDEFEPYADSYEDEDEESDDVEDDDIDEDDDY